MLGKFLELLGLDDVLKKDEKKEDSNRKKWADTKGDVADHSEEYATRREITDTKEDPSVVLCRQENCLAFMNSISSAIAEGRVVIADLRKMDKDEGQQVVDFLCREAYSKDGTVSRLCAGIFMASARKTLVEEWIEEKEDIPE
jgi:FtsZ-interacting cell division protein YlmF